MIVLDIETTGLDPIKHSIIEIGAIDFNNPQNQFYKKCRIWDGAEIDTKALEINGSTLDEIKDFKRLTLEELIITFIGWLKNIEDRTIAGQNVDFDILFLKETQKKFNIIWDFGWRKVDQHSLVFSHYLSRNIQPPLKNGLSTISGDKIMDYVGLPIEPKPHLAINGAKFELEALSRLIYGKAMLEEFTKFIIPSYLKR